MTATIEHGTSRGLRADGGPARSVPVVVIGAGQAGLSAAYHLRRRGIDHVVLDGEDGPGGAWRHRWRSLRMATVNGIFDLPGMAQPPVDFDEPAVDAVPRYFAAYEREFAFPVLRPVRVQAVRRASDVLPVLTEAGLAASELPGSWDDLLVYTDQGTWAARGIINATGTWMTPNWPWYPGAETFAGRQLHVVQYVTADEFAGQHVVVVGGGISAIQLLAEISAVTTTTWVTRRPPVWFDGEFTPQAEGRAAVARAEADARAGRPIGSVVSYTGLFWTPYARTAAERGALVRHPMFTAIEPDGVLMPDGTFQPADVILWATGFRQAVDHLDPLRLRNDLGGIALDGTAVAADPRIHLIGYGPSQSTVGANRAGRGAAVTLSKLLAPGSGATAARSFG
jgi:cation diffusion facilitator CzcD-associated flavoprotein CzcO